MPGKEVFMGELDMTEKTLESYNDVFADMINGLLFDGRQIIAEDDLAEAGPRSLYKADGKLHEQERDTAKYWKNGTIRIALYGMENQTNPDKDMPLRLYGYDGAAYRAQLLADKDSDKNAEDKTPRYPVITLVLYFGYKKHWNKPLTLLECLDIPEELTPFVNDYKMNLFEIAYLTDEQLNYFHSDFRIVADYFVQMQRKQDYVAPEATIRHVNEFLQLMSAMTGDNRYEKIYSPDMERRPTKMCDVLDKVENNGIEKGEDSAFSLVSYLLSHNRLDDLKKATEDNSYRDKLMKELFPKQV